MVGRHSQSESRGDETQEKNGLESGALLRVLYDELRRLAAARLRALPSGQTLEATALVHEAYLRLARHGDERWNSRAHFFGSAARAMREVMVDRARRKARGKHGGGWERISLSGLGVGDDADPVDMLALHAALEELERVDARKSEVVHLRYFAGLTIDQTAEVLGLAPSTIDLHWKYARVWLQRETVRRSG